MKLTTEQKIIKGANQILKAIKTDRVSFYSKNYWRDDKKKPYRVYKDESFLLLEQRDFIEISKFSSNKITISFNLTNYFFEKDILNAFYRIKRWVIKNIEAINQEAQQEKEKRIKNLKLELEELETI